MCDGWTPADEEEVEEDENNESGDNNHSNQTVIHNGDLTPNREEVRNVRPRCKSLFMVEPVVAVISRTIEYLNFSAQ